MYQLFIRQWIFALFILSSPALVFAATQNNNEEERVKKDEPYVFSPIVVTAEKREKNVQEIPSSVTVISSTQIEDYDIGSTLDIVNMTPNLYITETGNGSWSSYASMRGVASAMTGNPTVGFYVDGIYYANMDISFYDVERVEVLRGPQGTLYGRGSMAGVINVITKKPSSDWESTLSLEGASFNSRTFSGVVSGPLVKDDVLNFKAAVRYHESDGYYENRYNGSDDIGGVENTDARLTLSAAPTEKLALTLTADIQRYDTPKFAPFALWGQDGDLRKKVDVNYEGENLNKSEGAALRAEYEMASMTLVSITSGRGDDNHLKYDADFGPVFNDTFVIDRNLASYSQEFRLVSNSDSAFQWLGGLFLLSEDDDRFYDYHYNLIAGSLFKSSSSTQTVGTAAFGQASYGFSNGLELTLGLRYDREEKDFDYTAEAVPAIPLYALPGKAAQAGADSETFDAWLPKASLNYRISEAVMPYISASRGFRSGGFNDSNIEVLGHQFDPEFNWNYELGVKTSWLNNRLQVNGALFYIARTDMLVEQLNVGTTTVILENAAKAHSQGVEIELLARPMTGWELSASAAYTAAEYDEFKTFVQAANGDKLAVNYSGNKVIDSPQYTANLNSTYRFENGIFLNGSYRHIGEIYLDTANTRSQGNYGLLGAKVGYEHDRFDLYLFANNILDQEYVIRAVNTGAWYAQAGAPLTIGATLRMRF